MRLAFPNHQAPSRSKVRAAAINHIAFQVDRETIRGLCHPVRECGDHPITEPHLRRGRRHGP